MQVVLFLHILCVFVWLSALLVEGFEATRPTLRMLVSLVEGRLDLIVALPAFLGVLLTGGYLASHETLTPLQALTTAAGLIALGVNVYGLLLARQRPVAATGSVGRMEALYFSSGALIAFAMTLSVGLHLLARA